MTENATLKNLKLKTSPVQETANSDCLIPSIAEDTKLKELHRFIWSWLKAGWDRKKTCLRNA